MSDRKITIKSGNEEFTLEVTEEEYRNYYRPWWQQKKHEQRNREAMEQNKDRLFEHIPKEIDIHGLRREYCKGLYDEIKDNKELRDKLLKNYPERHEFKTQKDANGNSVTKEIKSDVYRDREGNVWNRDDIYVLSQALGHNRLDVSITHYLKS